MTAHNSILIENTLNEFSIEARILSRKVAAMGMAVYSEEIKGHKYLCWQGSNDLFAKTMVFSTKIDFENIKRSKYVYPWGLRGDLERQANGDLIFFISWCYLSSRPISYMRNVKTDAVFNRFKEKCFEAIESIKTETDLD